MIALTGATGLVGRWLLPLADLTLGRTAGPRPHRPYDLTGPAPDLRGVTTLIHAAFSHVPGKYRGGEGDDPQGFLTANLDEAIPLVNKLAPEHLELAVDDPDALFARVRHAGSVFLGRMTPEAIGDYVAGPNHVLPTGRRARFASGLSVLDFMKRTSFLALDAAGLAAIGPAAVALAEAEGLPAHAKSVALRL